MPLFDFACSQGHVFEDITDVGVTPACPTCGAATSRLLAAPSPLTGKERASMPGPSDHGCCGSRRRDKGCVPGSCCGKA